MNRTTGERGIALIAVLLVMMLVSALMVGFTTVIMSDQRFRGLDRDHSSAFYAAHSGIEKLTADLGNLFQVNFAPSAGQLTSLTNDPAPKGPPVLPGFTYTAADGTSGYKLTQTALISGPISGGPYQGLIGLKTMYKMDVTARTLTGGDVHLTREMETVTIPVFQFGTFSDVDLSFFAGPDFNFGGRVHTNGNLFLAEGDGRTLTMADKVTAVGEVVRTNLANGAAITIQHNGAVRIITAPGAFRDLVASPAPGEGSVIGALGSVQNEPTWTNTSIGAYHGNLRNGRTGARLLNLPLVTLGGANTDLITRPATATEDVTNPALFGERFFTLASLRILLSDTAADIMNLPTINQLTAPVSLEAAAWPPVGYVAGGLPIASSGGPPVFNATTTVAVATVAGQNFVRVASVAGYPPAGPVIPLYVNGVAVRCTGTLVVPDVRFTGCTNVPVAAVNNIVADARAPYLTAAGTGLIGGFIKIEQQDINGVWNDVTMEILNLGIASRNLWAPGACGGGANDPNPNAVIRIQRLANFPVNNGTCGVAAGVGSALGTDYWPELLYDTREGNVRDVAGATTTFNGVALTPQVYLGGVMNYLSIDVNNLRRWLLGQIPAVASTGGNTLSVNGYAIYFSDRRSNRNAANLETGELGFEDNVNPIDVNGLPNATLDAGEDVNNNSILETYGNTQPATVLALASAAPLDNAATMQTLVPNHIGQSNRILFFRRALKLENGTQGNIPLPGLTVASENPVYIQGDWNATAAGFVGAHAATAVIADAVTLLSNNWNDNNSFLFPYAPGSRPRATSWYRLAIIGGKGRNFPRPTWGSPTDFGTDGGAHNFLRFLEAGGGTINYRGAIATFFYNRQALGTYKCCATVYGAPTRGYNFDIDFLSPPLLPPRTPVFRDVNTLGFTQEIRPGK